MPIPEQLSAMSQAPTDGRQTTVIEAVAQVPSTTAPEFRLQAWQSDVSPPLHALSLQTPSTQNPVAQLLGAPQAAPVGLPPATMVSVWLVVPKTPPSAVMSKEPGAAPLK